MRVSWRSVGAARLPSLCSTPGCAPAPPLRASTPIACHRHVPCTTQSAPPAWLCVARSSSAIGFAILDERSSLSPGKRLHHQRSSSSHDASPHPQGDPLKFGISTKDSTRRRAHAPYSAPLWSSAPNALPHSAPLHSARPTPLTRSAPAHYQSCSLHILSASSPASLATSSSSTSSPAPSSSSPASSSSSSTPPPRKSSISGASPVSPKRWFAAC